ncbi:MAG: lysylphosphatidylglycerol synthase transmembrane domain-containing protein [Chloroflexi bacterium]|nr:lysylphosphatidylglycerol synthase transmembrane domain-containing protein [Chloroflexota bacterium]
MRLPPRVLFFIRIALGFSVGGVLTWWLVRDIDLREFFGRISQFSWPLFGPVFALVITSMVIRAARWRMLFGDGDKGPSFARLFFVENTGIGLNNLAPVRLLAEPIQFGYLTVRDGHNQGAVLASIVQNRALDLVVTLAIMAIGFSIFPPADIVRFVLWSVMAISTVALVGVVTLSLTTHRWALLRKWSVAVAYGTAWHQLASDPGRLFRVMLTTLLHWVVVGLAAWVIAGGVGITLSFPVVLLLTVGILMLGMALPGLPSGFGPFEFAATLLLSFYGVSREPALAFGVILHVVLLIPPVAVAAITLLASGPPWSLLRSRTAPLVVATTQTQGGSRSGSKGGAKGRDFRR